MEVWKRKEGKFLSLEIGTCSSAKGGGDPFMVMEGTGKEGRPLRCNCVPEEVSVDHEYFPNIDSLCLHSRTLRKALPPTLQL